MPIREGDAQADDLDAADPAFPPRVVPLDEELVERLHHLEVVAVEVPDALEAVLGDPAQPVKRGRSTPRRGEKLSVLFKALRSIL